MVLSKFDKFKQIVGNVYDKINRNGVKALIVCFLVYLLVFPISSWIFSHIKVEIIDSFFLFCYLFFFYSVLIMLIVLARIYIFTSEKDTFTRIAVYETEHTLVDLGFFYFFSFLFYCYLIVLFLLLFYCFDKSRIFNILDILGVHLTRCYWSNEELTELGVKILEKQQVFYVVTQPKPAIVWYITPSDFKDILDVAQHNPDIFRTRLQEKIDSILSAKNKKIDAIDDLIFFMRHNKLLTCFGILCGFNYI